MLLRRKQHRLHPVLYQGRVACAFTCCVRDRGKLFLTPEVCSYFEEAFLKSLSKNTCEAHVYLFMPDHFHCLLEGQEEGSDLRKVVIDFKQSTGYWLSKNRPERWQHDFFDHVLRGEQEIEKHARYILDNPVRAGIVEEWVDYPYKGSTVHDLSTW